MPLWGNVDNAANSDIAALMQVGSNTGSASERTRLYGNVTAGAFMSNPSLIVGQFGVDVNESQATPAITHAGWVLRTEGTGLRSGRVTYETLVAMGSMSDDGSDDTQIPDYTLRITTNPSNASGNANVTLSVVATSTPSGAPLTYLWQRNAGAGWVTVANVSGAYFNATSATLTANAEIANANTFRATVSTTGAASVTTSNATVTFVA